jgi:acyl-CoA dehydrogenase family member 9
MTLSTREKQMAEAQALLGDEPAPLSLAAGLYFGRYHAEHWPAYPATVDENTERMVADLRQFCREKIDPAEIDRNAEIPVSVIGGLGRLGVLGACLPESCGGRGLTQTQYCRLIEVLGGHCGSTALFVNAHHSIGPRALVLFGTKAQQDQWLPKLATGEWLSAFALTEPQAGSDAGNVQTTATPTPDGRGYILNGEKRYITNGAISQVLTVMARTPVANSNDTKVTAFIVTPDMPGFQITEARMPKMGVRGTVTSRLAFNNMFVPKENVLGSLGKGLRVALTVLDYGRTTFGASCTGSAKTLFARCREHAASRVQFGQAIGTFELVKQKLANMAAGIFAMEAATYQTAALIDSAASDYMLETAMLKVFSTEVLWRIMDDAFQIHGGMAYFADQPFERMIRDARINTVGEGSNDVLRPFVALVGMRSVGMQLQGVQQAASHPLANLTTLGRFAAQQMGMWLVPPEVPCDSHELATHAGTLAKLIGSLGRNVQRLLATYREDVLDRQYLLARVADAATEIYVSSCVLARLEKLVAATHDGEAAHDESIVAGKYYLTTAARRIRQNLAALWDHDDIETSRLADLLQQSTK